MDPSRTKLFITNKFLGVDYYEQTSTVKILRGEIFLRTTNTFITNL